MVKRHILDCEHFKHILTTFGDPLNVDDMEDIFDEFDFDDNGDILTKVGSLFSYIFYIKDCPERIKLRRVHFKCAINT